MADEFPMWYSARNGLSKLHSAQGDAAVAISISTHPRLQMSTFRTVASVPLLACRAEMTITLWS